MYDRFDRHSRDRMTDTIAVSTAARRHPLLWPLLATLMIIGWSSGFVGIRYANQQTSVMLLLFWRTLISGLILLPFALTIGPRISLRAIRDQALFGVMAVFIYLGGFALAIEQRVPTGLVALIADLLPLAIVALSQPVLGETLSAKQWLGTLIAVIGVLIVSFDSLAVGTAPLWAYGLTVVSMLVFAVASVLHRKRRATSMPVHQGLCIHSLTGSVLFGICAWTQGTLAPPMTREFLIGMMWLVLIATFLAYAVYYTSLRLFPVAKVSAAIYLSPPVTMLWAWMLFSEPLTVAMFVGLGVTLVGVWMTSRN
jgi:Predicted permeases